MSKLVIGCGYLGRRVAAAWLQAGHDVVALTRSLANAGKLSQLGIHPIVGDICEPATLVELPTVETVLFAVGFGFEQGSEPLVGPVRSPDSWTLAESPSRF